MYRRSFRAGLVAGMLLVVGLGGGLTLAEELIPEGGRLPELVAAPIQSTSLIALSADRLTPSDTIELVLPAGLGEASGLGNGWTRARVAGNGLMERWDYSGLSSRSLRLKLNTGGLEPGQRGLLSLFSTDPRTGDQVQAHWWIGSSGGHPSLAWAGAARVVNMVRVTLAPGAPQRWADVPRDGSGRLLLRQTDRRLAGMLPWAAERQPFIQAQSLSAESLAASSSITVSTTWDLDFTNYQCESWNGLLLQVNTAPADAVITTFDISYTVYQSVDIARYKSEAARPVTVNLWTDTVPLYNGQAANTGNTWHTVHKTGLTAWAGKSVNFYPGYILGCCNLYGHESAYLDQWSLTLYYNTGGTGGSVDLVADSVSTDFDTIAAGGEAGYYYSAHVTGSGSVGSAFNSGVYLSNDAHISSSDMLLETIHESSALSAGDQFGARSFSNQVIIPSTVSPGTYWLGVIVDDGNAVAETDESNNAASHQITIAGSSSKPNLKVSGCSVSPSHVSVGGSVQLSYRAQNVGATGAAYFSYGLFVSNDQTFDASDQIVAGLDVPGGWPAGYDSGSQTFTIPLTGLAAGTYYVGFMADVSNQVPETNEGDNFCVAQVTVGSGGVTHWLIAGAASTAGGGNNWKTQISIVNPDTATHTANLYYVAKGAPWPGVLLSGPITLGPNQARFIDDVLASLRPTSGMLYVITDAPGPVVTTRTFNEVSGAGRFGQGITAEPIGSSCVPELILPMVHSVPNQYYTNLGLVQAGAGSFSVDVTIYASDGTALASTTYTQTAAFNQLTNIFDHMGIGSMAVTGGWIRIRLTNGCPAHWTAYASIVDESTGDPTYVAPVVP